MSKYSKSLIQTIKVADEELKNGQVKSFEEVFSNVYNIKVDRNEDETLVSLKVEKDGITVEFDPNNFSCWDSLVDICDEFDNTVKQGELLNA